MDSATFLNLLQVLGILFLILFCGVLCRRVGVIDDAASHRLSKLIIWLCQPMMIVGALISKPFTPELFREGAVYALIGFLIFPLSALFAFPLTHFFADADEQKLSRFALIFTNCGFLGFPVLEAIFPGKGAFYGAFFVIGFHVYIWTLGIWILSKGRPDIRLTWRKALVNFGTVPCLIGLLLYLSQAILPFPMPALAISFCNRLGDLCMPVSVLVTGSLLATQSPRAMVKNGRLWLFNAYKLLVIPLLVSLVAKLATLWMADPYRIILFATTVAALPSASTVTMLGELYDVKPGYAAETVGSSSLLTAATLPLMYFVGDLIARL